MATVLGTIRDPAGNIYANATIIASFVGQNTTPGAGPYLIGGLPQGLFELVVPGETDSSGNFSMTVTGNDTIQPTPSQWRWTVVSNTTPAVSFSVLISITGASIDISAALQAAAASLAVALQPGSIIGNLGINGNLNVNGITTTRNLESTRFADQFTGADIGVQINAAIADLGVNGGTVVIPNGSYSFSTQINMSSKRSIILRGCGGLSAGASTATVLTWTGVGTTTPLNLQNTLGCSLRDLFVVYNNAGFTGVLIDASGPVSNTAYLNVMNCSFGGAGLTTSSVLISLDKAQSCTIQNCRLGGCVVAIQGAATNASFSNANQVLNCTFSDSAGTITTCMIQNPVQGWVITGNTFELGSAAGNNSILNFTGTIAGQGIFFAGNWSGDSNSTAVRTLINWVGVGAIIGNDLNGNQTNDTVIAVPNGSFVVIAGNEFTGALTAVSSGGVNARIFGAANLYQTVTTAFSGTIPTVGGMINLANDRIETFFKWIFTDQIFGTGTLAAPAYGFNGASAGTGLFFNTNGRSQFSAAGVACPMVDSSGWFYGSTQVQKWANAADPNAAGAFDTGLSRISANVIGAGNGTAADVSGEIRSAKISATYNAAGTVQTAVHLVQDTVTLSAGGTATATLVGSAVFTSASSYTCTAVDDTGAAAVQVTQTNGSSITFTGTANHVIRFICVGN